MNRPDAWHMGATNGIVMAPGTGHTDRIWKGPIDNGLTAVYTSGGSHVLREYQTWTEVWSDPWCIRWYQKIEGRGSPIWVEYQLGSPQFEHGGWVFR